MLVRKEDSNASNFALLLVVLKRHNGSEGVKKVGFCFLFFVRVLLLLFFVCFDFLFVKQFFCRRLKNSM